MDEPAHRSTVPDEWLEPFVDARSCSATHPCSHSTNPVFGNLGFSARIGHLAYSQQTSIILVVVGYGDGAVLLGKTGDVGNAVVGDSYPDGLVERTFGEATGLVEKSSVDIDCLTLVGSGCGLCDLLSPAFDAPDGLFSVGNLASPSILPHPASLESYRASTEVLNCTYPFSPPKSDLSLFAALTNNNALSFLPV